MIHKPIEVDLNCGYCGERSEGLSVDDNEKFVWVYGDDDPPAGEYHEDCHHALVLGEMLQYA